MALSTEEMYDKAVTLSKENFEDNFLDLAGTLRRLYDRDPEQYHKVVEKTDLGSRKAYYLVEISRAFEPLPVHRSKLKSVGWTKLKELSKHVTKDNVDELIELAEGNTVQQLQALMKGEKPKNNAHCVLTYFTPKQYAELEEVLLQNGAQRSGRGLLNKEEAIMNLVKQARRVTS
jgi:hypothetical protein